MKQAQSQEKNRATACKKIAAFLVARGWSMRVRRDRRPLGSSPGERATFAAMMLHAVGIPVCYGITDDGVQFYAFRRADLLSAYLAAGSLRRLELRVNAKALNIVLPRWAPPPPKAAHDGQ
jgi:hypothetical protein